MPDYDESGKPGCSDCMEIVCSQKACVICGERTQMVRLNPVHIAGGNLDAPSVRAYGTEPLEFWFCHPCKGVWDGGRRYDFACLRHGGQHPDPPPAQRVEFARLH